ncbi:MAG: phospho-N-acetylmuramoyl-pentapeptide-transferase [Pseudomonadota bacterium]|nr:MAG: phospho-N-acetylmuramoyl-pentapeptide-transferase [Pseudomonadota bacterium]
MLAALLHSIWQYQIFKSVVFRGGMAFLTAYFLIVWVMPSVIRAFRKRGITSDFITTPADIKPYTGAPPIMGGGVLVMGILLGALLWCNLNQYVLALLVIMLLFGIIGAVDDIAKVINKRRVESGHEARKAFSEKADGISGRWRLIAQFAVSLLVVTGLYLFVDIDGHLTVPLIPLKTAYPYLPKYLFIPFMTIIIVGGANAVNLTDGMDSLATVPLMTCAMFVGLVAYIGGDPEFAAKLKIPSLSHDIKELAVLSALVVSAGVAFLKYNSPPALIYMGDLGALALGSMVSTMFIFVKAELFLPIVGGVFVFSVLSSIIQRTFFRFIVWRKGRLTAERYRFFLRSPYHHHLQRLWTYSEKKQEVVSVWIMLQNKLGIDPVPEENKLLNPQEVNSRVIWHMHLKSIWLFVFTLIIYFKIR